jgi:hypothetical protein
MNSTSDNAELRGQASGEGRQSDQPIQFAGCVLGAGLGALYLIQK